MHVYLAAACPQCRSTTMVVTNQDDAWGKDHAINCGVCSRRVIAAGLTGRGLQWHGSTDPEVWGNKLRDFASEGVDSVTTSPKPTRVTADAGRAELPQPPMWSTMPREIPRCVASRRVPNR